MAKRIGKEAWKEYIDRFSSYEGSLTQYCIENSISKSQFYYIIEGYLMQQLKAKLNFIQFHLMKKIVIVHQLLYHLYQQI